MTVLERFEVDGTWEPSSPDGVINGVVSFTMLVENNGVLVAPTLDIPAVVVPTVTHSAIDNNVLNTVELLANTAALNIEGTLYYRADFSDVYYNEPGEQPVELTIASVEFAASPDTTPINLVGVTPAAGPAAVQNQTPTVIAANITDATTLGRQLVTAPNATAALTDLAIANNADGTLSVNGTNTLEPLSTVTIATTSAAPVIGQTTYYNATSGNLTPTLPALSGLRVGARLAVRRDPADVSTNTVTLACAGSDTFYSSGGASTTFPLSGEQREFQVVSVAGTKFWAPAGAINPVSALDKRYSAKSAHTLGSSYRPLQATTSAIMSAMAPGTVTTGVGSIIGWASAAGKYRFLGMIPGASGAGSTWCQNNNNSGVISPFVNSLYAPITVEFWSNATAISVYFSASTQPDMWAIVDDKRIQDGWQHANFSTGPVTWQLTQTSAVWRKYRICIGFSWLQGIAVNAGASIVPTNPGFQLAVAGDSYISGGVFEANAISPGVSGTIAAGTLIGELEQITGLEIWRFAIGGTGYVANAGYTGGNYGSTQRVGYYEALANNFNACLIYGGVNDWPTSTATVVAAAQAAWAAWANAHPEAELIVTSFQPGGNVFTQYQPGGDIALTNAGLKAAAAASPSVGTYVDLCANPYVFGTGYDGSPVGDGNRDVYISADNAHPTHLGWRAAGEDLAHKLSQVVLQKLVAI